ncbi:hypothetical protein BCEN4_1220005 [Burkholderia cenocepacia]|nr:hypothetical protein BCEN4_1220005 [Burkholderia cenocepacia]
MEACERAGDAACIRAAGWAGSPAGRAFPTDQRLRGRMSEGAAVTGSNRMPRFGFLSFFDSIRA